MEITIDEYECILTKKKKKHHPILTIRMNDSQIPSTVSFELSELRFSARRSKVYQRNGSSMQ